MSRQLELAIILASTEESVDTYSSALRRLNKKNSKNTIEFMKRFKDAFDDALEQDLEEHQNIALRKALAFKESRLVKLAKTVIAGNNPVEVGKTVAHIVKVILARVPDKKDITYNTMRNKILNLNVAEISGTALPDTAAYGQSLTLIKTLLSGYDPEFVRKVLISASNYLN